MRNPKVDPALRCSAAGRAIRSCPGAELIELEIDPLDAASGEAGLAELTHGDQRVTAVFCINDLVALGAMRYARTHGLAVPARLAGGRSAGEPG